MSKKQKSSLKEPKITPSSDAILLSKEELSKLTGLSEFMLSVCIDLLDKSSNATTLIDIVCPNADLQSLSSEVIERERAECAREKKKTSVTDDDVRKFIVEKREKKLTTDGVRLAGSNQHEKMENIQKDMTLVSEFLGYARTTRGYFVYAYYTGPSTNRATEQQNPKHWLVVHKSQLSHFHRRIRDYKPYYRHTKFDQVSFKEPGALGTMPSYDPRYIMSRWLAKEGRQHKQLLSAHRHLFDTQSDFVTKHYEEAKENKALHYYEERQPDILILDLTEGQEAEAVFNVDADRLKQQKNGYKYTDKELCHVSIEEFPPLSRIPLPEEIDLVFEEFLKIAQHVHVSERQPRPPESYVCDPFVMVKAAIMALNVEMQIKRVVPLLGDAKLQIIEGDNIRPLLDFLRSHKSCTDEIKQATFRALLAFLAVELMTREQPANIEELLKKAGDELVLIES